MMTRVVAKVAKVTIGTRGGVVMGGVLMEEALEEEAMDRWIRKEKGLVKA